MSHSSYFSNRAAAPDAVDTTPPTQLCVVFVRTFYDFKTLLEIKPSMGRDVRYAAALIQTTYMAQVRARFVDFNQCRGRSGC
jgi:hypothetical protein